MKVVIATLAIASLFITACAMEARDDSASQTSQALSIGPRDDPPDPGPTTPDDLECAARAVACGAAVGVQAAACVSECATVAGCALCAVALGLAIQPCISWGQDCLPHAARVGEACTTSERCETNGLHCVEGACRTSLGNENNLCESARDCRQGMECRVGDLGDRFCWRPRQVGESCAVGDCAQGLTCDPQDHRCSANFCSPSYPCPAGNHCIDHTCFAGCLHDSDCHPGDSCTDGRCIHTDVTVCNCDGSDPPGTCIGACPTGGGGPGPGGGGWGVTCYNFYDSYTVCAQYREQIECEEFFELVDSFCI